MSDNSTDMSDPNHCMHHVWVQAEKVRAERKAKEDQQEALMSATLTNAALVTPGAVIESGGVAEVPYPGVPPAFGTYARALVNAVEYIVRNNAGVAKIPLKGFGVSTLHLRNSLRTVRNFMMANPPLGFAIGNLTFVSVVDGIIVRDKRRAEPYKVTAPVVKPDMVYPIVATPEVISAFAVLLNAKDESGQLIIWPDFVLAVVEEENIQSYNDLMRASFPSWWIVDPPGMWVEIKHRK